MARLLLVVLAVLVNLGGCASGPPRSVGPVDPTSLAGEAASEPEQSPEPARRSGSETSDEPEPLSESEVLVLRAEVAKTLRTTTEPDDLYIETSYGTAPVDIDVEQDAATLAQTRALSERLASAYESESELHLEQLSADERGLLEDFEQGLVYSRRVMESLSDRLDAAERMDVPLERSRLSSEEQQALDYVEQVRQQVHPRLVVTATHLNVRTRPRIDSRKVDTLEMGDTVHFCGGHPGPTQTDEVEVIWYWVDEHGYCDRSEPKRFIASKEVRDGEEHWLIRWHDYPVKYMRHKRSVAAAEGREPDAQRYRRRCNFADLEGYEILRLYLTDPDLLECLLGVTVSRGVTGVMGRALTGAGQPATNAAVASYLCGRTAGMAAGADDNTAAISIFVSGCVGIFMPGLFGTLAEVALCYLLNHYIIPEVKKSIEQRKRSSSAPVAKRQDPSPRPRGSAPFPAQPVTWTPRTAPTGDA